MTYLSHSRRNFLKGLTATSVLSATGIPALPGSFGFAGALPVESSGLSGSPDETQPALYDGPPSPLFGEIPLTGNRELSSLAGSVSEAMTGAIEYAPRGRGTAWGIPFRIPEKVIWIKDESFSLELEPFTASWLVFLHTTDIMGPEFDDENPEMRSFKGEGRLNEHLADYCIVYADGSEEKEVIRARHQVGTFQRRWGENSVLSVARHKPIPVRAHHEQMAGRWGISQTRVTAMDRRQWDNWLWAWENPHPGKRIAGFRFTPVNGVSILISAISGGTAASNPLRWQARQKALLSLPGKGKFDPDLSGEGLLSQIQLDLGQVISATPRLLYPEEGWEEGYNNKIPEVSDQEIIIEYTAHPEARFHLTGDLKIPVKEVQDQTQKEILRFVPPASRKVRIRVVEKGTGKTVAAKLHIHGEWGEYLAPVDRHRQPNNAWFEDYSVDFIHRGTHICTYIPGETTVKLPVGKVYVEVSKGFEIRPVRRIFNVTPDLQEIEIEIEKVLHWREKGWVSADTHVHFLSPNSALLEGSGEGVNIINLLASQWGELFTNIGDFDGKTTIGSREAGGEGEYLVRVGTENRQHVLGHISLLGYEGNLITPLTTGGVDESALGDPVEILLTEWAEQCRSQNGIVILPHFPNPRLENAAAIVSGNVHGVEMTSWGFLYYGISPYCLADWYRYLNCGYFVAAVGGTDKMSAGTAVGTIRTYARIPEDREFTYEEWKSTVERGETFVTYGPLLDFSVDGRPMGSRIEMGSGGGTVDVHWQVASVTAPLSRVELIANGVVLESLAVPADEAEGHWRVKVDKSSWYALLVRGHYPDKPEIIAAHSSPVMVHVEGSAMLAAADALTILEQIEGAMAYIDTIGTRAEEKVYRRMRLKLESAHRALHNRLHQMGHFHRHSPLKDHPEGHT